MNVARKTRDQSVKTNESVHDVHDDWDDNSLLKAPTPQPGYVQRWVRTSLRGNDDQGNLYKKYNRGWKPRLRSSIPADQFVMHVDFEGSDVIGIKGMILMERPEALAEKQSKAITAETQMQMAAVKQTMLQVHDPKSGLSRPEFSEETQSSRGRIAPIDD